MSIIRPYVDHKPGESLSLSALELVHCLSRVGVRGACIHHMWRGLSVKPPGLLEGTIAEHTFSSYRLWAVHFQTRGARM